MERDYDWRLQQIIENMKSSIDRAVNSNDPGYYSYIVAYASALKYVQEQLTDEERKSFGLDFDIDKKYM